MGRKLIFYPSVADKYRLLFRAEGETKAIGWINKSVGGTGRLPKDDTITFAYHDCWTLEELETILDKAREFLTTEDRSNEPETTGSID